MKVSAFKDFVCPVDGLSLLREANSLRCKKGHGFDVAREGYCNLLLVQQKASLEPGDNKEMVAARRRFLDGGHFTPIVNKLFEMVSNMAMDSRHHTPLRIVDAGCGEGYYLNRLKELAKASDYSVTLELAGFDISKWAVKAAAKRSDEIAWLVAGNKKLPFSSDSIDVILSMFGFPAWESFKAVQPRGGYVILIEPGVNHLIELRKIIYPQVNVSRPPSLQKAMECGYILKREDFLQFSISLEKPSQIQDLLAMTPHAFKIERNRQEDLKSLSHLNVLVDLTFRVLQLGR